MSSFAVIGLGLSGFSAARRLAQTGNRVLVSEKKSRAQFLESSDPRLAGWLAELEALKVPVYFGDPFKHVQGATTLVISPGVPLGQDFIQEAKSRGVSLINEPELALREISAPVLAITGTSGKTTTTTLIGEILKASGFRTFVGGNIGRALVDSLTQDWDFVVAELSSFQLDLIESLVPKVAVVTSIDSDHLDRYLDFEDYFKSKQKLIKLGNPETLNVLNLDQPPGLELAALAENKRGSVLGFSLTQTLGDQVQAHFEPATREIVLVIESGEFRFSMSRSKMLGDHNIQNWMAALLATVPLGVGIKSTQTLIDQFVGIPHRLEWVRELEGVNYYNDSKSTNLLSLEKSLSIFGDQQVILIAGGRAKGLPFARLRELVQRKCSHVFLYGEAKDELLEAWQVPAATSIKKTETLFAALQGAHLKAHRGQSVLLSPACASTDLFRNFEERGDRFKAWVREL